MKKNNLIISIVIVLLFASAGVYWLLTTKATAPVFDGLSESQVASVETYLSQQGIPFEKDPTTQQILVDENTKHQLRMELVGNGIINEGRVGFEIFDENDYGMTDFAQKINFQRALQGELEKTIVAIEGIRNVRVHLKLDSKKSLFEKRKPIAASVVLYLEAGKSLSNNQVFGIKKLVSGAVERLDPENVNVIDSTGRNIGETNSLNGLSAEDSIDNRVEKNLLERANNILLGVLDEQDFSISLSVELDRVSKTSEIESIPNANNGALIKKVSRTQVSIQKGKTNSRNPVSEESEYRYGRQLDKVVKQAGQIAKISVGVVITTEMESKNIEELQTVLSAGLGINNERGDVIQIVRMPSLKVVNDDVIKQPIFNTEPNLVTQHAAEQPVLYYTVIFLIFIIVVLASIILSSRTRSRLSIEQQKTLVNELNSWVKQGS